MNPSAWLLDTIFILTPKESEEVVSFIEVRGRLTTDCSINTLYSSGLRIARKACSSGLLINLAIDLGTVSASLGGCISLAIFKPASNAD